MTRSILILSLTMACEPSKYAGMGNACPSVSEAYAASDRCDEPASTVEEQCVANRLLATLEGCQDEFDEYYHCIAAWAESGSKNLTLRCGENSWGLSSTSSGKDPWCQKEDSSLEYCLE